MSENVKLVLTLIIGYLLGSISTGVIVSRVFGHKDIRSEGSGNSGTTNMLRVMGKKYALLTFAGDLFKGIAAVLIAKHGSARRQAKLSARSAQFWATTFRFTLVSRAARALRRASAVCWSFSRCRRCARLAYFCFLWRQRAMFPPVRWAQQSRCRSSSCSPRRAIR